MWCKNCNIETNEQFCPVCGSETAEDIPVEVYWCKECTTPIIHFSSAVDKGICPICGEKLNTSPLILGQFSQRNVCSLRFYWGKNRPII